jgi:hypothetical protein
VVHMRKRRLTTGGEQMIHVKCIYELYNLFYDIHHICIIYNDPTLFYINFEDFPSSPLYLDFNIVESKYWFGVFLNFRNLMDL